MLSKIPSAPSLSSFLNHCQVEPLYCKVLIDTVKSVMQLTLITIHVSTSRDAVGNVTRLLHMY